MILCIYFVLLFYIMGILLYIRGASIKKMEMDINNTSTNLYDRSKYILISSYIFFAIAVIMNIVCLCISGDIAIAVSVIKTAGLFIAKTPLIFFVPIINSFCLILYLFWWLFILIYLYSLGNQVTVP